MSRLRSFLISMVVLVVSAFLFPLFIIVIGGGDVLLRYAARRMEPLDAAAYLAAPASPMMADRQGGMLFAFLAADDQWRFPVALEAVSPLLARATLAAEDKRFYDHAGVDARAALRAAWMNVKAGRVVSGASTLTMQLVKRQSPTPRTLAGKARQALLALRLDNAADKDAILEAYLNTAPYGGNLVGVEAAARRYFGKSCRELTLSEAALLAGLPKSPVTLDPLRYPAAARQRRDHVLRRMLHEGMITQDVYEDAAARPPGAAWHEFPAHAPHLAMSLRDAIRQQGTVRLTLDGALQARLETLLSQYLKQFDNQISNGAIIVADTRNGEVLARVGSADFNNARIGGQVDLCRAPRAPGSALKPFVYALALARQRLYPTEALLDNTLDYGVYNPGNFDGTFNGMVSAAEALRWSLNVPAVQAQRRAGIEETVAFLQTLGFDTLGRSPEHYGLGLVLGNCEVRLESLVGAYLALARLGEYAPLRLYADANTESPSLRGTKQSHHTHASGKHVTPDCFVPRNDDESIHQQNLFVPRNDDESIHQQNLFSVSTAQPFSPTPSTRVLSEGVALALWQMMEQPFPDEPWTNLVRVGDRTTRVCWKTGTSTGYHDAWAVAFNRHYVVGAWLGNNDGRASKRLVGAQAALPLAARVFRSLPVPPEPDWPEREGRLVETELCAATGLPKSPWCPVVVSGWLPKEQYLHRRCDVHRPGQDGGVTACWPGSPYSWDLAAVPTVSPPLQPTVAQEQQKKSESPARRTALSIIAPANNATYILTGDPKGDRILLNAGVNSVALHWYHNDRYLGRSERMTPLYLELTPGEHRVACMDNEGQTAVAAFTVLGT